MDISIGFLATFSCIRRGLIDSSFGFKSTWDCVPRKRACKILFLYIYEQFYPR